MLSLSLYFLISASLLLSTIVKEYISNYDIYETVSLLYSNKMSQILLLNFTVALLMLISKRIFELLFGSLIPSQWQELLNSTNGIFLDTIFVIPALLHNYFNGSMNGFLILIPNFFSFLVCLIRSINNGLHISQNSFHSKFHIKIFIVQFAVLYLSFISFCSFVKYFRNSTNPLSCLISEQCIISFLNSFSDIVKHIIFIYDINNPGLFRIESVIRYNYLCRLFFEFMIIMVEVMIELYASTFGLSFYILRPKTIDMLAFSTHLHKYQNWLSLSKMLNDEIPDATEEDLNHEDQCIICRHKMKIKIVNGVKKCDAKRLPCGHCYHLSCLQQWIRQQMKCPLCQYDLKQLIMPNNEETDGENNDDNFNDFFAFFENLNGHDDNIRNVHQDFQPENENRDENVRHGWRIADLLEWILPVKNNINPNIQDQIIHHHHRHHHHHRSYGADESHEHTHKHKHSHHKKERKAEKIQNTLSNENNVELQQKSSFENISSLADINESDLNQKAEIDEEDRNAIMGEKME